MLPAKEIVAGGGAVFIVSVWSYGIFDVLYMAPMPEEYKTIESATENKFREDFQKRFIDAGDGKNKKWWEWSFWYRHSKKSAVS